MRTAASGRWSTAAAAARPINERPTPRMLASSVYARTDSKKYRRAAAASSSPRCVHAISDRMRASSARSPIASKGCERLTVQIERVDEVVTARRELGESTEGDAGSFVVAEPPLNRKCVLGLLRCGLGVSLESVDDPVEARGEALSPGEAERAARLGALARTLRRFREVGSKQTDRAACRGNADLSRWAEPRCPLTRLGPLLVRLFVRPEGPGREPRRDQCAHATACGGARRIGLEKAGGVVARRQVLSSDVPVHPEVAAKLEAGLEGVGVACARDVEKLAESGFEIGLVRDALLDRRLLGRALDAVSDLASEGRVPMSVSQRDPVRLPGSLESFSRVFANRLQHLEPGLCLDLHERLVHERLEPVE